MADLHRQHAGELAELTTLEMGKPIAQAKAEVELSAAIYEYYATTGPTLLADEELDIAGAGRALVRTAPIGPLLGVMPWNFPYYQAARFVAPNLLLGNTILLKHASNCPQQALRIAEIIDAAGAPAGVYQNVFASTEQVATMIASPLLQGVSLTGSERAGSAVGELAGQHLKKCVLELGGSDPFIVLPGADLDRAVVGRGGRPVRQRGPGLHLVQADDRRSLGLRRVPRGVRDQGRRLADRRPDERADPSRADGLASRPATNWSSRSTTRSPKAPSCMPAARFPNGAGAFYPATVLTGSHPGDARVPRGALRPGSRAPQGRFGDEAIELANDSPYGLGSAVFTRDEDEADYVANRLEVGMVGVNTTIKSAPDLPFGGVKNSGIGRELGRFGLDEFANKKLVRII